jgi:hypothetical protein
MIGGFPLFRSVPGMFVAILHLGLNACMRRQQKQGAESHKHVSQSAGISSRQHEMADPWVRNCPGPQAPGLKGVFLVNADSYDDNR